MSPLAEADPGVIRDMGSYILCLPILLDHPLPGPAVREILGKQRLVGVGEMLGRGSMNCRDH
jgi:hypothetical protein